MVTNVNSMVTNVFPMLAEESNVANPQKFVKISKNFQKCKNIGWQHCICQGITWFLSIIGEISSHRCHGLTIGYYRWHQWGTQYIFGHWQQSQHQQPTKKAESSCIVIGFDQSPSVPGLMTDAHGLKIRGIEGTSSFCQKPYRANAFRWSPFFIFTAKFLKYSSSVTLPPPTFVLLWKFSLLLQWKPLNVITMVKSQFDNINWKITSSVITIRGFHCN